MAANDLVYNTVDPVLFTPDYAFLRYNIDKKQARYDEGVNSVSQAYNNLKQNLTDPTNKERRDKFINDAQEQLKKISRSDLSLGENVNAANNVFNPLATDEAFIYDAFQTARISKQKEIMDDWANSSDPETRKKYNPKIERWLLRDLDVLRNGKGDIKNYKGMQNREAFAYLDPQDILIKAAKDQGFTFKTDSVGSPYIVSVTGGVEGIPSYQAFSKAVLQNDQGYQRQLKVIGEANAEDVLDEFKNKAEWEGKSNYEKYYAYGKNSRYEHRISQKNYLQDLEKNLNRESNNIDAFANANQDKLDEGTNDIAAGNTQTVAAQMVTTFKNRISNRNSLKTDLGDRQLKFENDFGTNAPDDDTFAKQFAKNPIAYFSDQQYVNDVQTFTNIKKASYSREIKADEAYLKTEANNLKAMATTLNALDDQTDNALAAEKLALKGAGKKYKTVTGEDGVVREVEDKEAEISYQVSPSATQLYTTDKLKKIKEQVEINRISSIQNISSSNGALSILNSTSFGMDNSTVGVLKKICQNRLLPENFGKDYNLSAEDKKAINLLRDKAIAFAKNAGINLDEYLNKDLTATDIPVLVEKATAGYNPSNMSDAASMQAMQDYKASVERLSTISSNLAIGKQAVITAYNDPKKHPEFNGMFKKTGKDASGKDVFDIIDEDDIIKQLDNDPAFKNKYSNITKEEKELIANAYLDGKLNANIERRNYVSQPSNTMIHVGSTSFNVNGKEYFVNHDKLFNIDPDKYNTLNKKINQEIQLPEFENEQGMFASPRFILRGEVLTKTIGELSSPSQANANIYTYDEGTGIATQVTEDQTKIREALMGKNNADFATLFTTSPLNDGNMAVAVHLADKDKTEGKTYYFPINNNTNIPETLKAFTQAKEVGEFEKYKKEGKTYEINTFQGSNIKALIHPNMAGDDSGYIEVFHKPLDPKTNKYSENWEYLDPMNPRTDFNTTQISFPEIKQKLLNKVIYPHVIDFITRKQQNSKSTPLKFNYKSLVN